MWISGRNSPNVFDVASDLDEAPAGGPVDTWLIGVLAAGALVMYGVVCVFTQDAWCPLFAKSGAGQLGFFFQWHGQPAAAVGWVYFGMGLFAHFHWFWSSFPKRGDAYKIGEVVALLCLVAGLGRLFFAVVIDA